jgi:starch phosphorylase
MSVRPIRTFTVLPYLPERLKPLHQLAYNMWWCWNHDAVELFSRIDVDLFKQVDHSPIRLLSGVPQSRIEELSRDEGFLAHLDRVTQHFESYMAGRSWYQDTLVDADSKNNGKASTEPFRVAYFSAEFGIHESIPEYSGGLGVLAGDHLKSASDLGLPLVGVSLMYRQGYLRQYLNHDGWQQERYPENNFFNLPLIAETDSNGKPLLVDIPFPKRTVYARIWRIQVGRVPLYLLDANIPENNPDDRNVTAQLYGGDQDTRIRQEMILGIGGLRALRLLGQTPTVCHMNEGHSAFCALERIRLMMQEHRLDFATALEAVKAGTVFTTHTPVPAGNDSFPPPMIEHYLGHYINELQLDRRTFLGLGRVNPNDEHEPFGMTVLALRTANSSNGVSQLHGVVSRKMWKNIWPGLPSSEVPIIAITNGIHAKSWISNDQAQLMDRYLGVQWEDRPTDHTIWKKVEHIPDTELWRIHERCRERLVSLARMRLREQFQRRGLPQSQVEAAEEVLDPDALTIGFARRFATYKRGTLIFRDRERLAAILNNRERPVQLIFSGKSHPRDQGGKELIAQILQYTRQPEFRRRVVFIEDYDMNIARHMVQGCDVWLNNPRRPLEASGTSGMKAAANGVLNLSVLDGWWVEGYQGDNGFAIGQGEEYTDLQYQDEVESRAIYDILETEVVPAFYNRGSDGIPRQWLRRMKRCISTLVPVFNTNRMVMEYTERCYLTAHQRYCTLYADNLQLAAELARWRKRIQSHWSQIRILPNDEPIPEAMRVGGELPVQVQVDLGELTPDDVEVQLVTGLVDSFGEIAHPSPVPLTPVGPLNGKPITYAGKIICQASGRYGYGVRVLPKHRALPNLFEPGLIHWG